MVGRSVALALVALTAVPPAAADVRVVPAFPLERYAGRGAVGLLVPGAGPTVTRAAALAALRTGEVRSSLLGGQPEGPALPGPRGVEVYVALPPPGRSENDVRYPIAVVGGGFRGLLTSDSTRIPGLVSVADVARGRLGWQASRDPVGELDALDDRIAANDRLRLPLTIALAVAVIGLALLRPALGVRAVLLALAANLWLEPWIAVPAALAALLPLELACASLLAAYGISMGLDAETVALSPLGPSQAGRFYGLSNLLETLLLVPALVGAARAGRAGVLVAALALVVVAANGLGADGGGLLVLLAGFAVLALRGRLAWKPLAAALAAGAVLALAVGSSHVTDALGGGPAELWRHFADRLEISARRATGSLGQGFVMAISLAGLAWTATRRPRGPVTDALLVALAVSLVVNDTPTDVVGIGAACAFAVRRLERPG